MPGEGAPFCDADGDEESFKHCMLRVASCSYERGDTLSLMKRLRFLVVPEQEGSYNSDKDEFPDSRYAYWPRSLKHTVPVVHLANSDCRCNKYSAFPGKADLPRDPQTQRPLLTLTSSGELADCDHFVAVSYCWRQPEQVQTKNWDASGYCIQTSGGIRQNRAPANVLDRVIAYATLRGFKAIWIDQECIQQDDPEDKEFHIQGMDAIYSAARHVAAVLNFVVMDRPQMALFEIADKAKLEFEMLGNRRTYKWFWKVSRPEFEDYKEYARDFVRAMESESWFFRAWPFQESMVAMSTLHYLLPCKPQVLDLLGWVQCLIRLL